MLPAVQKAHFVHGNRQKVMAAECGVTESTFYKWITGRRPCPKAKRQSVDRAFGVPVDWLAYDREYMALQSPEQPQETLEPPRDALPSPITPKPQEPTEKPLSASQNEFDDFYGLF